MFLNLLFSQDSKCHKNTAFFFSLFFFNFIFKLYIIVLVLPNIKMNPPQVYMCSPSWTLLQAFLNSLFSSVAQSYPTLCDPMDYSKPGLPVHHQLPEFTQTRVHWVGDAIQPSHPPSSPSPPTFNLFQHQGLFQWASSSHQMAKVLEFFSFSISPSNEYSGLISFKIDCFDLLAVQGTLKSLLQHHSSKASILWHFDKSSVSSLKLSLY